MNESIMTPIERKRIMRTASICTLYSKYVKMYGQVTTTNRIINLIMADLEKVNQPVCFNTIRTTLIEQGLLVVTPRT